LSETVITTSLDCARRLAVTKQHLAGKVPTGPATEMIVSVIRDLGFVQWDPVDVVAPSHLITLWSRVGKFRMSDLDRLLWDDKKLFEHWSHAASIVLMEDYPLFYSLMKRYPESLSKSWGGWKARARKWLAENKGLRNKILKELGKGPLRLSEFEDHARGKRSDNGWTSGSDVFTALLHMQMSGDAMVVGHEGRQDIRGLSETFLARWVAGNELRAQEVEREGAGRTTRALGTASPSEINPQFLRGRYRDLKKGAERVEAE